MRIDRRKTGMPDFNPPVDQLQLFMGSMPHTQVAISVKTHATDMASMPMMSFTVHLCSEFL